MERKPAAAGRNGQFVESLVQHFEIWPLVQFDRQGRPAGRPRPRSSTALPCSP